MPAAAPKITASSTTNQTIGMPKSPLHLGALPLGNGKSSATPARGLL